MFPILYQEKPFIQLMITLSFWSATPHICRARWLTGSQINGERRRRYPGCLNGPPRSPLFARRRSIHHHELQSAWQVATRSVHMYQQSRWWSLKAIWGDIKMTPHGWKTADIAHLGVLEKRDADRTDVQIVPSTEQCGLCWWDFFFSSCPSLSSTF